MEMATSFTKSPESAVNAIGIYIVFIITQFILHIEHDQHAGCNTSRQTNDIDYAKARVIPERS